MVFFANFVHERKGAKRRMKKKQVVSGLLATVMIANIALVDMGPVQAAENLNLAKGCKVTASEFELEQTSAVKAVDGDKGTHWGTSQGKMNGEWLEVSLNKPTNINQIKVFWERTADKQNIKKWKVEVLKTDGTWEIVKLDENEDKEPVESTIDLKTPVLGTKVKLTILEADTTFWANVGINEIEVYGQEQDVEITENKNHMQNDGVTITASSSEADILSPEKVKDGKTGRSDRWACKEHTYEGQWLKTTFPKVTKVGEIDFTLFMRDVEPNPSNIKGFDLEYKDDNGEIKTVHIDNTKVNDKKGYEADLKYIFDKPVYMSEFTVKNFDVAIEIQGNSGDNNISISEIAVYSNKQSDLPEDPTLDNVVSSIKGQTVGKEVTKLALPTVPEGFTIESNGADFEQIIGSANEEGKLPIVHPLTDKTVNLSFNVKETATGKVKNTGDLEFVVKGTKTQEENKNTKPSVIPEIQEWHSESTEKVSVESLKKVTYTDDKLKAVVDEFVKDYEDFTGIKLTAKKGAAEANAFNFELKAPDTLLGEEGYTMDIKEDRINVASVSTTGNMYGMQTILQMNKENGKEFKVGQMRDYPRFETRGFLFDVARKAVSLDMMKEVSRTMRYYKMNDLQIHLNDNYIWLEDYGKYNTEDEGFKAYEAFRLESSLKNENGESPTAKDYHMTKEEFKTFIQEERAVGMKIVPEIDVPAHAVSFTKVWPDLKIENQVSSGHSLIDHFDLTNPKAVAKIKEIFDDYTKDETFDDETTIHIGADEFLYNAKSYREFVNDMVPYVKKTNKVRMWGGLTRIKDNPLTTINKDAIENVEMNLWSKDWADGIEMYNLGYDLINTIDDFGYMVPNGNKTRANAYGDLLNVNRIFNEFEANKVRTGSGYKMVPAGDDQMLGAAFALWNDNIDKRASGLSESDLYWRFFDAMPFYAEKTWAATGKEKGSADALAKLAADKGTGPNTNPYYQEEKKEENYESYDFENGLKDTSENKRDLKEGKNAEVKDNALVLKNGESYVTSPIDVLGNGNEVSFDIKLEKPAKPGDILFEADAPYGTHDIRIMEDGKLGFTRELYSYYFDYELPVGKSVNITITVEQQKTSLYVNGEFVADAKGKFIHNDMVKKDNIANATFALPLERIGSKTNAVSAVIDNVVVTEKEKEPEVDIYNKSAWTGSAESETPTEHGAGKEGVIGMAFDSNSGTHWHSDWSQTTTDKVPTSAGVVGTGKGADGSIWAEVKFDKGYEINQVLFTPRQDTNSGLVTKATLYIQNEKDGQWKEVVKDKTFAADKSEKAFTFEKQMVYGFKFVATQSSDGWVTVSEFDIANQPVVDKTYTVYVSAEKGGKVSGGKDVSAGESVTVTAMPDKGYVFEGWYRPNGEKVSEKAEYTFKVNGNTALIAKFEKTGETEDKNITDVAKLDDITVVQGTAFEDLDLPEKVSVTYGKNETAEVDVTWEKGTYNAGECKTYVLEGTLTLPEGIANPDGLKAIVKVTVEEKETPVKKYTVSVNVKDSEKAMGTVSMDKEDGVYEDGMNATVTATPNEGYEFVNWTDTDGKEVSSSNPYTFAVTANTTLTANFKKMDVKPEAPTAQDILDALIADKKVPSKVAKNETEFVLPKVPEDYTIQIAKVNPEGIISLDGTVTTPKKDTDVIVTISVTDLQGKTASADFTVKVEGKNEIVKEDLKDPTNENANKKDPNKDKKPVKTGDATAAAGWMLAMTAAGAVVLVRKRNS